MNNKHAYLIVAHNNFNILKKLLQILDNENNDIFLHIDKKIKKIDISNLKKDVGKSEIFIYNEISVNWAAYSQTEVEIFLLDKAIKNDNYAYYHLLSGVDFPIKSQKFIHDFFEKNYGKEFVHFAYNDVPIKIKEKVQYNNIFLDNKYYRKSNCIRCINKLLVILQKKLKIKKNKNLKIMTGANWFSITNELACYIVENRIQIRKTFKGTMNSDEFFIQTLIQNTDFVKKLYINNYNDDYHSCMRCIDWTRGRPYIYNKDDFSQLINSDYLFARKFDENVDYEIIELLFEYLKEKKDNEKIKKNNK